MPPLTAAGASEATNVSTNIEKLELTPAELASCRAKISDLAYRKWIEAGCPCNRSSEFWLEAEKDWVERHYVPHRFFEDEWLSLDEVIDQTPPRRPK